MVGRGGRKGGGVKREDKRLRGIFQVFKDSLFAIAIVCICTSICKSVTCAQATIENDISVSHNNLDTK